MGLARLWRLVTMSMEQQRTVEALWLSDGICSCGRPIIARDPKLCLAQVNTSWCTLAGVRNTLAIGIYCTVCADAINVFMKNLRQLPERDKLKRTPISG